MHTGKYLQILSQFADCPFFTNREASNLGVPSRMLAYYAQIGKLEKIAHGLYRMPQEWQETHTVFRDLFDTVATVPRGIICLLSALQIYNLTDQIMREFWIAIPNCDKCPIRSLTRFVRMRNCTLGVTTLTVAGWTIPIFDRERTVVDTFRYLDKEIAIKALKAYLASENVELKKIANYAQKLRVNLEPYLLALTT